MLSQKSLRFGLKIFGFNKVSESVLFRSRHMLLNTFSGIYIYFDVLKKPCSILLFYELFDEKSISIGTDLKGISMIKVLLKT